MSEKEIVVDEKDIKEIKVEKVNIEEKNNNKNNNKNNDENNDEKKDETTKRSKGLKSIKMRITLWYSTLMFAFISAIIVIICLVSYNIAMNNMKQELVMRVNQFANDYHDKMFDDKMFEVKHNPDFKELIIYDSDKEYLAGDYNYNLSTVEFKDKVLRKETINGQSYYVYDVFKTFRLGSNKGIWIRGAQSISYGAFLSKAVILTILITVPIIILLSALGGYYITRSVFSPINDITKTANTIIDKKDLSARIVIDENAKEDELYDLSLLLNEMLEKIECLMNNEKKFTQDVSHELKTPISVIMADSEYLLDITNDEKEKELAQNILDKVNHMTELVNKLLLLTRMDYNRQKVLMTEVDVKNMVDKTYENVKEMASDKKIKLEASFNSNKNEAIKLETDETLFLSILNNLVTNAIKYGKENGTVEIDVSQNKDKVEIKVKDDGVGIAKENIDKIWTRFYREDDARHDEYGSVGLGLSMVKSEVKLLHGKIKVSSEQNVGTTFTVTFTSKK